MQQQTVWDTSSGEWLLVIETDLQNVFVLHYLWREKRKFVHDIMAICAHWSQFIVELYEQISRNNIWIILPQRHTEKLED